MKRGNFRLEKLLKVRRQIQRQTELQQQLANMELESAFSEVATIQAQLVKAARITGVQAGELIDVGARIQTFQYMDRMNQLQTQAEETASEAEQKLLQADKHRRVATIDAEALNFLHEQQIKQHQQQTARELQNQMDEVAMQQWAGTGASRPLTNKR